MPDMVIITQGQLEDALRTTRFIVDDDGHPRYPGQIAEVMFAAFDRETKERFTPRTVIVLPREAVGRFAMPGHRGGDGGEPGAAGAGHG